MLSPQATDDQVLFALLKQVSRSFYLSLIVLPQTLRRQISLAYLFCRAADTIADTALLPPRQRFQALDSFRRSFLEPTVALDCKAFGAMLSLQQVTAGERQLFTHLPTCFALLARMPAQDRHLIEALVLTLTQGMRMDLTFFPEEDTSPHHPPVHALPTLATLDLYTYYVAGVVGEFWTKLANLHFPLTTRKSLRELCTLGKRFGQGLQMTNILKDLGKDLQRGRCYLPASLLEQLDLHAEDLRQPQTITRLRPLLAYSIQYALEHLDQAHDYIRALPYRAFRLRLSCMWPLLFAVLTLELLYPADTLLSPESPIKISRKAVYRIIFLSYFFLLFPGCFSTYYTLLCTRLRHTLPPQTTLRPC